MRVSPFTLKLHSPRLLKLFDVKTDAYVMYFQSCIHISNADNVFNSAVYVIIRNTHYMDINLALIAMGNGDGQQLSVSSRLYFSMDSSHENLR